MLDSICPDEACTGCMACLNACPLECIDMNMDEEGFFRPVIDRERCNDCGTCTDICPALHRKQPDDSRRPEVYACWHKDEAVRYRSSSGGAFSAFAETILDEGGVVFGAAYDDDMRVVHVGITKKVDLPRLRGSKYVQSDVGRVYGEIRQLLAEDRRVLFSGTPCQVEGLKAYLGENDSRLFTCDLLCKGVSSPGLFLRYVSHLEKLYRSKVISLDFRNKDIHWQSSSTKVLFAHNRGYPLGGNNDSFKFGYSAAFTMRKACYQCPYSTIHREGDVSLGDFWGIGRDEPFVHDTRNGISLVLVNSSEGREFLNRASDSLFKEQRSVDEAVGGQRVLKRPFAEPSRRRQFFTDYQSMDFDELTRRHLVDKGFKRLVKTIIPRNWLFHLRRRIPLPRARRSVGC